MFGDFSVAGYHDEEGFLWYRVCKECKENRYHFMGTERVVPELTKPYANKNQIISNLVSYSLLIIDDLGIE